MNTIKTLIKLSIFLSTPLIFSILTFLTIQNYLKNKVETEKETLLTANYQSVLWKDLGQVFEPTISIPVYYSKQGFQKVKFLLDSGAVISSLPREHASLMGYSLAKLPRLTFSGFGNKASFAYQATTKILLIDKEIKIPVVFTEAAGTKPVLGRMGFFEILSVNFNHHLRRIEIKE